MPLRLQTHKLTAFSDSYLVLKLPVSNDYELRANAERGRTFIQLLEADYRYLWLDKCRVNISRYPVERVLGRGRAWIVNYSTNG